MIRLYAATSRLAIDPSASVGLGHLMRAACLRRVLTTPSVMLGRIDATLEAGGLRTRRRRVPRALGDETRVVVVDRNTIGAEVMAWRLRRPSNRVVWIKRGCVDQSQAVRQSGFVAFADLVVVPGDVGEAANVADEVAAGRGKLQQVGVCHAYQVVQPSRVLPRPEVFISLGAFEPAQREDFARIRVALRQAGVRFLWSSYTNAPLLAGFPLHRRVAQKRAFGIKSECSAFVCEGGYNSVHEALFLNRPALFVANDGAGRELQSSRIVAAKRHSPLAFDARRRGDLEAWIIRVREHRSHQTGEGSSNASDYFNSGFAEMGRIIGAIADDC
jgi:hypothetical protein